MQKSEKQWTKKSYFLTKIKPAVLRTVTATPPPTMNQNLPDHPRPPNRSTATAPSTASVVNLPDYVS